MVQILYVSQHKSLSIDEVQTILSNSFSKNKVAHISGALVYIQGYFIQCLEGESAEMEIVFEKIQKDTRHENLVVLSKEKIQTRLFDEWSMSFVNAMAYESIVKKYFKDEAFNPYFMEKQALLQLLKEISLVM